jgi:S1-C subfamily serine protease
VFALDAIAYPGNSGSPVWHPDTGEVLGVVNSVYVKGAKEAALTAPSGISYAIPVKYVQRAAGAGAAESEISGHIADTVQKAESILRCEKLNGLPCERGDQQDGWERKEPRSKPRTAPQVGEIRYQADSAKRRNS